LVSDLLGGLLREPEPPTPTSETLVRTVVVTSLQLAASALGNADHQRMAGPTTAGAELSRGYIELARAVADLAERLGYIGARQAGDM